MRTQIRGDAVFEMLKRSFAHLRSDAEEIGLFRYLVIALAEGEPVPIGQMAAQLGHPPEEIERALARIPSIERDEDGRIIGAGVTLRPTPHRLEIGGRNLFTWCALDTLMFPGVLRMEARVESPCRGTGSPVRVLVDRDGGARAQPSESVVSLVAPEAEPDIRRSFCDRVHFFSSPDAALPWLMENPDATVLPIADAYQAGRLLSEWAFGPEAGPSGPRTGSSGASLGDCCTPPESGTSREGSPREMTTR